MTTKESQSVGEQAATLLWGWIKPGRSHREGIIHRARVSSEQVIPCPALSSLSAKANEG